MLVRSVLITSFLLSAASAQQPPPDRPPTLTVSADATIHVTPDQATVRFGAEQQADTAQAAQQQVDQALQKAITDLQQLGIADHDIQTAGMTLSPVYSQPSREPQSESSTPHVVAYRASQTLAVTVSDLGLAGKVIDTGMSAGLDRIESLSFGIADPTPARLQALGDAMGKARRHAEALAKAAGQRLAGVRSVQESGGSTPTPRFEMAARRMTAGTPVEPGQLDVTASVVVEYRIEPTGGTGGKRL